MIFNVLAGWEGSAHDGRVLEDARAKGFPQIAGKFFLRDASYALRWDCLTPFRGVRYHLKEFRAGNAGGPRNAKELFNLKHSSARNAIERCFGVLKRRFPIVVTMPSFYLPFQCVLVNGYFLLYNFIRRNQLYEDDFCVDDVVADANDDDNLDPDVALVGPAGQLLKQWRTDTADNTCG